MEIIPNLLIAYDSQTGNTKKMAEAIGKGAKSVEGVNVVVKKIWTKFFLEELIDADAIILGSPTHYSDMTVRMEYFLRRLEKLNLKGKIGGAFGSIGYSGKIDVTYGKSYSVEALNKVMKSFGMTVIEKGLIMFVTPKKKGLKVCKEWGRRIAKKISRKQ